MGNRDFIVVGWATVGIIVLVMVLVLHLSVNCVVVMYDVIAMVEMHDFVEVFVIIQDSSCVWVGFGSCARGSYLQ